MSLTNEPFFLRQTNYVHVYTIPNTSQRQNFFFLSAAFYIFFLLASLCKCEEKGEKSMRENGLYSALKDMVY